MATAIVGTLAQTGVITGAVAQGVALTSALLADSLFANQRLRKLGGALDNLQNSNLNAPLVTQYGVNAPRRLIYGRTRIAPLITFAETSDDPQNSGDSSWLNMAIVLGESGLNAVNNVYFDGKQLALLAINPGQGITANNLPRVNDSVRNVAGVTFNAGQAPGGPNLIGRVEIQYVLNGGYSPLFQGVGVPKWSTTDKMTNIAYILMALRRGRDLANFPDMKFDVEGRKVWDPRTNTTGFSTNSILCILDFLKHPFGMNLSDDELDLESFKSGANICDLDPNTGTTATSEGKRLYTLDGVVSLDQPRQQILNEMLSSCNGILVPYQGKYRIVAGWKSIAADTFDIKPEDVLEFPTVATNAGKQYRFNSCHGRFISEDNDYQSTDFSPFVDSAAVTADGEPIRQNIVLKYTNQNRRAHRIAQILTRRSRRPQIVKIPCKPSVGFMTCGNWIRVRLDTFGSTFNYFDGQDREYGFFQITEMTHNAAGNIDITARVQNDTDYDNLNADIVIPSPPSPSPSPSPGSPPSGTPPSGTPPPPAGSTFSAQDARDAVLPNIGVSGGLLTISGNSVSSSGLTITSVSLSGGSNVTVTKSGNIYSIAATQRSNSSIQGVISSSLSAGNNVTLTTSNGITTISSTGGGAGTLSAGANIAISTSNNVTTITGTFDHNDVYNQVQVSGGLLAKSSVANVPERFALSVSTTALDERVRDTVGNYLVAGNNVTITRSDSGDRLTISAGSTGQNTFNRSNIIAGNRIQISNSGTNNIVISGSTLSAGSNVTLNHNSATNTTTISATGGSQGAGTSTTINFRSTPTDNRSSTATFTITNAPDKFVIVARRIRSSSSFGIPNVRISLNSTSVQNAFSFGLFDTTFSETTYDLFDCFSNQQTWGIIRGERLGSNWAITFDGATQGTNPQRQTSLNVVQNITGDLTSIALNITVGLFEHGSNFHLFY